MDDWVVRRWIGDADGEVEVAYLARYWCTEKCRCVNISVNVSQRHSDIFGYCNAMIRDGTGGEKVQ